MGAAVDYIKRNYETIKKKCPTYDYQGRVGCFMSSESLERTMHVRYSWQLVLLLDKSQPLVAKCFVTNVLFFFQSKKEKYLSCHTGTCTFHYILGTLLNMLADNIFQNEVHT